MVRESTQTRVEIFFVQRPLTNVCQLGYPLAVQKETVSILHVFGLGLVLGDMFQLPFLVCVWAFFEFVTSDDDFLEDPTTF